MFGCFCACVMFVRFYDWVLLRLYDCVIPVRFYDWVLV